MAKFGMKILGVAGTAGILIPAYLTTSKSESVWKVSQSFIRSQDTELAHSIAVKTASWGMVPKFDTQETDKELLKTSVLGLTFDSPLGLAAGFDKNAECIDGMLKMGFAFVEVGSVTPQPQAGNPKPRLFRLEADQAVINRMGFNSYGQNFAHKMLSKRHSSSSKQPGILGINLGKNKTSPDAVGDFVQGVLKLGEFADYLVINVSSPNTPGLRKMQGRKQLQELIEKVLEARKTMKHSPPLLVKLAPDLTKEDLIDIVAVVMDPKTKVDGLILTNTTISRPESLQSQYKTENGGLSGQPLKELSTCMIKDMYLLTKGSIPIIGVGGIASGEDAYQKICNGASLVQLYTGLAINGPPLVGRIKKELAELLRKDGFSSVSEAVGVDLIQFHCPTPDDIENAKKAELASAS